MSLGQVDRIIVFGEGEKYAPFSPDHHDPGCKGKFSGVAKDFIDPTVIVLVYIFWIGQGL